MSLRCSRCYLLLCDYCLDQSAHAEGDEPTEGDLMRGVLLAEQNYHMSGQPSRGGFGGGLQFSALSPLMRWKPSLRD